MRWNRMLDRLSWILPFCDEWAIPFAVQGILLASPHLVLAFVVASLVRVSRLQLCGRIFAVEPHCMSFLRILARWR